MGAGRFDSKTYADFTTRSAHLGTEEIYTSREMPKTLDPKGVVVRESRDSADNPESTPIIVGIDVTGSMGMLADAIARKGLGVLFEAILDRKPITDPHIMFMAIGDANYDRAPLQVSQFEADARIIEQLTQIWIEHGGGGNSFESYDLPWYFAAYHTVHDAMEKRGKRGYLFTIGDEQAPRGLTAEQIKHFIGDDQPAALSTEDVLAGVQRLYNVYHIVIEEGSHARNYPDKVRSSWAPVLGQNVIYLADHKLLAETIVSTIEVAEGGNHDIAVSAWGENAKIVHDAIKGIEQGGNTPRLSYGS